MWPDELLLEYGERIRGRHSRFCRYVGNKANSSSKELNIANIYLKGAHRIAKWACH